MDFSRPFWSWLLAAVLFLSTLALLVAQQRRAAGALEFLDERAYAEGAMARELRHSGMLGLERGQAAPATEGTLWVVLLAAVAPLLGGSFPAAAVLAEAFAGLWFLWVLGGVGRLLGLDARSAPVALLLGALAPGLALAALEGRGMVVASLLLAYALFEHLRGLHKRESALPISSAAFVGLLMWLRVEFVAVWLVFLLHALVDELLRRDRRDLVLVLVRGLSGFLVLLLCVYPLVVWNLALTGVAWPRVYGAPLHMDAGWGTFASYGALVFSGLFKGMLLWFGQPIFHHPMAAVLALIALGLGVVVARRRGLLRRWALFPGLLVLLPLAFAPLYPLLGLEGARAVFGSACLMLLPAMAFGLVEASALSLGAGAGGGWRRGLWVLGPALALMLLAAGQFDLNRNGARRLSLRLQQRAAANEVLASLGPQPLLATDRPGLYAGVSGRRVLDITGRCSAGALRHLNAAGRHDGETLASLARAFSPSVWVLWSTDASSSGSALGDRVVYPGAVPGPDVWRAVGP